MQVLQETCPDKVEIRFTDNPLGVNEQGVVDPTKESEQIDWADVVLINNILKFGGPYTLRVAQVTKERGKFLHFDTDDLLTELYDEHKLQGVYKENQLDEITKLIYLNADLVTVTQSKFAHRIQPYVSKVLAVVKNAIDYSLPCWNAPRAFPKFARVGWAGGIHHAPDVKIIRGVPHLVNQKVGKENVKWDFYGAPPPDPTRPKDWQETVWPEYMASILKGFAGHKNYQVHYAAPPDQYGFFYANMDIAIAPLKMNAFNDSKSDIKIAEAGRYKVPLIASNVGCYYETIVNGKTGYLIDPDAPQTEWTRILTKVIKDKKHRTELGENLHAETEKKFNVRDQAKYRLDLYERAFRDVGYKIQ